MAIDKEDSRWNDLGPIQGVGIDSVSYAFGTSSSASEQPTNWSEFPPQPGAKGLYLWMYIKLLLTDATSYQSTPAIIGIVPAIDALVGD